MADTFQSGVRATWLADAALADGKAEMSFMLAVAAEMMSLENETRGATEYPGFLERVAMIPAVNQVEIGGGMTIYFVPSDFERKYGVRTGGEIRFAAKRPEWLTLSDNHQTEVEYPRSSVATAPDQILDDYLSRVPLENDCKGKLVEDLHDKYLLFTA
ncbi:uncharacterized protein BP5553_04067 [Venustampulla echinocandica]|uniref:Uncharacterized protein n=1 Tax=Venustampulla echinocandica TaxID=2656787 RepID=A0A370TW21_9HELO|nr:uncharacterized protein BP5553_04067 [Venustampulla echinocandica]RDL39727.1 hypothetical protein BP5553_04067 [Venustampulla echinocandica]